MKKRLLFLLSFLSVLSIQAQQALTLNECVDFAQKNSESIMIADYDRLAAERKRKEAYSALYPQIKGAFDLRDNLILQTSILPGTFQGKPADEVIAVQFGQRWNTSLGLDLNWNILDASFFPSVKALKINEQVAGNNKEIIKIQTKNNVTKAYYAALMSSEKIKLAQINSNRTKKQYEDLQTLFANGQAMEMDMNRAYLNYMNQEPEVLKSKQLYEQSLALLKYYMGYRIDSAIVLADTLLLKNFTISGSSNELNPGNRYEYKNIQLSKALEQYNLKRVNRNYLPTVALYGYVGTQTFRKEFDMFSSNATWYGLSYIGGKINIPIFDGFQKCHQAQYHKIQIRRKEIELVQFEKQYTYEINNAKVNLNNAVHNIQIRKNNISIAEKILQTSQIRYTNGLSIYRDVVDAESTLLESQIQYINALYDYMNAKLELDRIINAE